MNVYTLDAIIAATILLTTILTVASVKPYYTIVYNSPEDLLGELIAEPGFLNAVYSCDVKTLQAYLNSFTDAPYNLTVREGDKIVCTAGVNIEGLAATATLRGWNGTNRVLIVSLRMRR